MESLQLRLKLAYFRGLFRYYVGFLFSQFEILILYKYVKYLVFILFSLCRLDTENDSFSCSSRCSAEYSDSWHLLRCVQCPVDPSQRIRWPTERLQSQVSVPVFYYYSLDRGRKLNVQKTFKRRPGRLLNVLYAFNLRPVSRW